MRRYKSNPKPESNYSKHASPSLVTSKFTKKMIRILFGVSQVGVDVQRLKPNEHRRYTKKETQNQVVLGERMALRLLRLLYIAAREQGWCDRSILDDLHNAVDVDMPRKEDEE